MNWFRRSWVFLFIAVGGMLLYGDLAAVRATVYGLSTLALILLLIDLALDRREKWGVFPTLNIDEAIANAIKEPLSSAIVYLATILLIIAIMVLAAPRFSIGAEIPDRAKALLPVLSGAVNQHWPNAPLRHIPAGQVEQESSWKQAATLKTSRELGRGLVQLTIAYRADGSERFNAYKDAVRFKALAAWDWRKDPYNTHYQLTYLVLTDRSNFALVRPHMINDEEAFRAALVCYNAGQGRWLSRRAMARSMGLPADRWAGGLELAHGSKEDVLLYGRALWQAVNEYPRVIFSRSEKYRGRV
jgi:hypothetical protein